MAQEPNLKLTIRVVPQTGDAGEVTAKDVLSQLLAELASLEAFDPGGEGDVRFILDDIRMNSPVTATIHPAGRSMAEAGLRTVDACRAVSRAVENTRRTGRVPLGTTQRQRIALRALVNQKRRRAEEFDTEVTLETGGRTERLFLTAAGKLALRNALSAEREDTLVTTVPKHREHGVVDGRLVSVGHYHARSAFDLESPVYGVVRCVVPDELIAGLGGEVRLRDVWTNVRMFVTGTLLFQEGGQLDRIVVERIDPVSAPASIDVVSDASFTSGMPAADYLRRLQEGLGG